MPALGGGVIGEVSQWGRAGRSGCQRTVMFPIVKYVLEMSYEKTCVFKFWKEWEGTNFKRAWEKLGVWV